ncbi:MAG: 30S ribosomal protein S15 [Candidatus Nanoarchaeia archaeon]|nr:30S ribosomal protein S15 [Candidatus Nanoarchaeia archaeon]
MARIHSRHKGKSRSKKSLHKIVPTWVQYKPNVIEHLILKLAKEGNSASQIGMILRDSYGIPDVRMILGKKITKILEEKNLAKEFPEDLYSLIKRAVVLREHIATNNHDVVAKRGLLYTESKILRLVKYYKRTNKVSKDWNYDPKRAKLLVQ